MGSGREHSRAHSRAHLRPSPPHAHHNYQHQHRDHDNARDCLATASTTRSYKARARPGGQRTSDIRLKRSVWKTSKPSIMILRNSCFVTCFLFSPAARARDGEDDGEHGAGQQDHV